MQEEEPGVSPDIPWDLCEISWQWLALVFLAHHFLAGLGLERLVPNEHCDLLGIKGGAKQPLITPLPAEMGLGWLLLVLGGLTPAGTTSQLSMGLNTGQWDRSH